MNFKKITIAILLVVGVLSLASIPQQVFALAAVPPWLLPTPQPSCCSNVVFIPGLEASRLYKDSKGMFGASTARLWEPHRNDNVRALFLDSDGKSVDQSIYTKDILDTASVFGISAGKIYQSFIDTMNTLVSNKTINAWKSLPYDWRLDPSDIVSMGVAYATTTSRMISDVEQMASSSQTGKVTLIAHSNGGLLAKVLTKALEQRGESNLLDKIIFVAVPALGTPSAAAALLHGYDQSFAAGLILKSSVARELGENMPGAYNLLPSLDYFNKVTEPLITFEKAARPNISSYENFTQFLLGGDGRQKPLTADVSAPNVLNTKLVNLAEQLHTVIDAWMPPVGTVLTQIAGWGINTVKSIQYSVKKGEKCNTSGNLCEQTPVLNAQPLFSSEGDKTVVYPSALGAGSPNDYFLNLQDYNTSNSTKNEHKDILETKAALDTVSDTITNTSVNVPFITRTKPDVKTLGDMIEVSMHSPALMDLYDTKGRHTGLIPNPDPDSDLEAYEENIPNSYYSEFAGDVYAGFPAEVGSIVKIHGTGSGTFTFDVSRRSADTIVATSTFEDIPVTPMLKADFVVSSPSLGVPTLAIDVDGNGIVDVVATSSPEGDPFLSLTVLKKTVQSFALPKNLEKRIVDKIDKVIRMLNKDRKAKAAVFIKKFSSVLEQQNWKSKKITPEQKETIGNVLDKLLDTLD